MEKTNQAKKRKKLLVKKENKKDQLVEAAWYVWKWWETGVVAFSVSRQNNFTGTYVALI